MKFFIPAAENAEQAEEVYGQLADIASTRPPGMEDRVYSITFDHNGKDCEAKVGEHINYGGAVDNAIVLAIFEGDPWQIVTSQAAGHASSWNNPAYVGKTSIRTAERFVDKEPTIERPESDEGSKP